jgi:CheY-like chemotaxis protein
MPKKILLADDSITIQKVVELTFSDGDYEVTAVNNGAKAIAKLSEMRPDIILSDIIMPEKNGYEVCEYVKSHPEYRNLPVVLLTGTFEPFDPDRADKAGCDAVVTKPFESQGLIQKVEELIAAARAGAQTSAAPAAPPAFAPEPSLGFAPAAAPFTPAPAPAPSAPSPEPFAHNADVFGAAPEPSTSTTEMPFETPEAAFGGETRAFPRMSFDELQGMAAPAPTPEPIPPSHEPAPWEEAPAFGGETKAFPRMTFDELQKMEEHTAPVPPSAPEPSPWDQPAPGGATQAFPAMSFEDLQKMAAPEPPPAAHSPVAEPEASPWDEPASGGGETRAFPSMNFDELQKMAASPESEAPPAPAPGMPFDNDPAAPLSAAEASPWDEEAPAFGGETRAFPRMSFDELQKMATEPVAAPAPEPEPEPEPAPWSPPVEASPIEEAASPFAEPLPVDESPFAAAPTAEPESMWAEPEPEPQHTPSPAPITEEAMPTAVNSQITDAVVDPAAPAPVSASHGDLTDEQVDRIARRVVQLMSEQVVKNIAWEVIPDLAEMVVKERIRQLESE